MSITVNQVMAWDIDGLTEQAMNFQVLAQVLTQTERHVDTARNINWTGEASAAAKSSVSAFWSNLVTASNILWEIGVAMEITARQMETAQSDMREALRAANALGDGYYLKQDGAVHEPVSAGPYSTTLPQYQSASLGGWATPSTNAITHAAKPVERKAKAALRAAHQADLDLAEAIGMTLLGLPSMNTDRWRSTVANFIPVIGTVKGITEAISGTDAFSGDELSTQDRWVSGVTSMMLPVAAGVGKVTHATATAKATRLGAEAERATAAARAAHYRDLYDQGFAIPTGRSYLRRDDPAGRFLHLLPGDVNDQYTAVVHGGPVSVGMPDGSIFSAQEFARVLLNDHAFNGQPIRLISCNTGLINNSFAQALANELRVPVRAPNGVVAVRSGGKFKVGEMRADADGLYRFGQPGRILREFLPK